MFSTSKGNTSRKRRNDVDFLSTNEINPLTPDSAERGGEKLLKYQENLT